MKNEELLVERQHQLKLILNLESQAETSTNQLEEMLQKIEDQTKQVDVSEQEVLQMT